MKRFIFLLAGFVFFSTTGWANDLSFDYTSNSNSWNNNLDQPFIFMEDGIEFSIFQDGQFDFYIPNRGPNVSVGFNSSHVHFSFNTGYNYNPYVQYDNFGAIIQIQNTPVFYDYYGRVNQVGNIFIDYNNSDLIHRIGGLQVFYRNNVFWSQRGFINQSNRRYVWRPWHRYYRSPSAQYCLLSARPYRRYYRPVRHVYYRPYVNNYRDFDLNRRYTNTRQRTHSNRSEQYVQNPRNSTERNLRSNIQRHHRKITRARDSRITRGNHPQTRNNSTSRRNSRSITDSNSERSGRDVISRGNRTRSDKADYNSRSRLSNQTERKVNPRKFAEPTVRKHLKGNSRTSNEFSRSNPNRNEKVKSREARRTSVQSRRSPSNRQTSNVIRNQKSKRNTASGRSSKKIR